MPSLNEEPSRDQTIQSPKPIDFLDMERAGRLSEAVNKLPIIIENSNGNPRNPMFGIERYKTYWKKVYADKGLDFETLLDQQPKVPPEKAKIIAEDTKRNNNSPFANLAETLPLFGNRKGILGDYEELDFKKTAPFDDAGCAYVDGLVTLSNGYNISSLSRETLESVKAETKTDPLSVRKRISFSVDVTTNPESLEVKIDTLRFLNLLQAKKPKALGYVNKFGVLGFQVPKVVIQLSEQDILSFVKKIAQTVTIIDDKMTINDESRFDEIYREFFDQYLKAVGTNCYQNMDSLKNKINDLRAQGEEHGETQQRMSAIVQPYRDLLSEYESIAQYILLRKVLKEKKLLPLKKPL